MTYHDAWDQDKDEVASSIAFTAKILQKEHFYPEEFKAHVALLQEDIDELWALYDRLDRIYNRGD